MPGPVTVFSARKIVTMDVSVAEATHVAVRDGIILEVGDLDDCSAWGSYTLDDRFADSILIPGLIESHAHLLDGLLWARADYVGPVDRTSRSSPRIRWRSIRWPSRTSRSRPPSWAARSFRSAADGRWARRAVFPSR
jgi:cytosine/adenosine deaminase-related metal-dependent hydrolase